MNTATRTIAATAAFAAFAAVCWRWQTNGWGSLAWLASIILMVIIRTPFARQAAGNTIVETRAVTTERVLLTLVAIGGTFLPLLQLATGVLSIANYRVPDWVPFVGLALLVPGLWLFWRSHADLGRNWSVTTELREDHSLTTTGVYSRIRHPMYTAIWILFAAQPFFVHNWLAGWGGLMSFALLYFVRVTYEEAMMRERFGAAYDDYCRRTGRLLPKLRNG